MGWKALKEHFGLSSEKTTIQLDVEQKTLLIGSAFISDLISIDTNTGRVWHNTNFISESDAEFKDIRNAPPSLVLALLAEKDTFSLSLPVYTYLNNQIVQLKCEAYGYPNVTHCGRLMYANSFSPVKEQVIARAKENAQAALNVHSREKKYLEDELAKINQKLCSRRSELDQLNTTYPSNAQHC